MVEASLCETQDPQTLDKNLEKINEVLAQNPKPFLCLEHKIEVFFVKKLDLSTLCPMCIIEHKPDNNNLVVFVQYVQEKREELKDLFQRNDCMIRKLNQFTEEARN